jgi:hypothetical protein
MKCGCDIGGFRHWWRFTKLRWYLRKFFHSIRFCGLPWNDGTEMTDAEYNHWFKENR